MFLPTVDRDALKAAFDTIVRQVGEPAAEDAVMRIKSHHAKPHFLGFQVVACCLLQRGQTCQGANRAWIGADGLPENVAGLIQQAALNALLPVGDEVRFHLVPRQIIRGIDCKGFSEQPDGLDVSPSGCFDQPTSGRPSRLLGLFQSRPGFAFRRQVTGA